MSQTKIVAILMADSCQAKACIQRLLDGPITDLKVRAVCEHHEFQFDSQAPADRLEVFNDVDPSSPDALSKALDGIQYAIVFAPFDLSHKFEESAQMSLNMLEAASKSGAHHIVYINSLRMKNSQTVTDASSMITDKYLECEKFLEKLHHQQPQVHWTVIHCGYFMQNIPFLFERKADLGRIKFPRVKTAIVDLHDIGIFAAQCILEDGIHHEKAYEINGREFIDGSSLSSTLKDVLRIDLELHELDIDELEENLPSRMAQFFRFMMKSNETTIEPGEPPKQDDLALLKKRPKTLKEYIADHRDRF